MFSRCPGLFIQPRITDTASGYPAAMFSPYADQAYPAAVIRWPGSVPSGAVWSKYRRCAMSALCARAAAASRASGVTAGQPALARSWLTSASTCAGGSGGPPSRGEGPAAGGVELAGAGPLGVGLGDTGGSAILGSAGLVLAGAAFVQSAPASAAVPGLVRVDQVGYLPTEVKQAYLMTTGAVANADFSVLDAHGHKVFTGTVGHTSRGAWNARYTAVYPITFSGVTAPGTYHIVVSGGASGSSPSFTVAYAGALYGKAVADGV